MFFFDLLSFKFNIIKFYLAQECPPNVPVAMCLVDPCQIAGQKGCAEYPKAICRPNFCGGCNSEWFLNGEKVDCEEKSSKSFSLKCLFPVNCFIEPCKFAKCAAFPNAVCINNYCEGCNAFFYENGQKVDCSANIRV